MFSPSRTGSRPSHRNSGRPSGPSRAGQGGSGSHHPVEGARRRSALLPGPGESQTVGVGAGQDQVATESQTDSTTALTVRIPPCETAVPPQDQLAVERCRVEQWPPDPGHDSGNEAAIWVPRFERNTTWPWPTHTTARNSSAEFVLGGDVRLLLSHLRRRGPVSIDLGQLGRRQTVWSVRPHAIHGGSCPDLASVLDPRFWQPSVPARLAVMSGSGHFRPEPLMRPEGQPTHRVSSTGSSRRVSFRGFLIK